MTLLDFHKDWAWFVVAANAVAGVWALAAHRYRALRVRALWYCIGVAEIAIFGQVILGVVIVNRDKIELPRFHAFYGFVAIATVGIIYSYRSQLKGKTYLLYGGGSLFLMGLALRAMVVRN